MHQAKKKTTRRLTCTHIKTLDFPKKTKTRPHSPAECLPPGEVGDVDEGVVEGGVDVGDAEDLDSLSDLRAQLDLHLLGLLLLSLAGGHLESIWD